MAMIEYFIDGQSVSREEHESYIRRKRMEELYELLQDANGGSAEARMVRDALRSLVEPE